MTVVGYQTLDEELKRLKTVERPAVIAAIALAHEAPLATRNTSDFADLGLQLINPWTIP